MPIASQMPIPPPQDFSEFEALCCDLWRRIWKDPNAQRNGRQGQRQHGVDVFGRSEGRLEGLQCKVRDPSKGSKLTIEEIERAAEEAERFRPALDHLTVATTALRDAILQEQVRESSESRKARGKFPVTVQFWDDIYNALAGHEDLLRKYFPQSIVAADSLPARVPSREEVEGYCRSLLAELERNLDPWLDLAIAKDDESFSADEVRAQLRRSESFVLVGPSGAGKSHLVRHLALDAIRDGFVPLVAKAKHFDGSFSRLLDEAVHHLIPCSAAELLRGCQDREIPASVIVDGLNEVEPNAAEAIVNGLLGVGISHSGVSLGVTTREESEELRRLDATRLRMDLPDQDRREQLSSAYNVPDEVLERWSAVLRSPLDFKLAGDIAGASASAPLNEYGFLHSYLQKKLQGRSEEGFSFLSRLAGLMVERLRWALPRAEVLRMARGTAGGESLVSQLLEDGILAASPQRISYWHERFQHFFAAEKLLIDSPGVKGLIAELTRPRYREALPLVIGAIEDTEALRASLTATGSQALLRVALQGDLGLAAAAILDIEAKQVLAKARSELDQFEIVSVSSEPLDWSRFEAIGISEWSALEANLLGILGSWIRAGRHFPQFFDLLVESEGVCVRQLEEKYPNAADRPYDLTFRYLAVFASSSSLAVATLLTSVRDSFHSGSGWGVEPREKLVSRLEDVENQTPIVLYLLCTFLKDIMWTDDGGSIDASAAPRLLRACKGWGIYHLDLEAADLAQQIRRRLPDEVASEVAEILESWLGENVALNGMTLEALSCYKPLEITTVEKAAEEIRNLLTSVPTAESNAKAAGIFYLQFEEVFEGVYYDALGELSQEESLDFHVRAALGADRDSLFGTSLLLRLVEGNSPKAEPALVRWAAPPVKTNFYSDTLGGGFLLAYLGLARLRLPLPDYSAMGADEAAWCEWGKILYWMHRADLPEEERKAKCRGTWERLSGELIHAAPDPWYWFTRYARGMSELKPFGFIPVAAMFRDEIRVMLEEGLRRGPELTSIFDHVSAERRIQAIISFLGFVGDQSTAIMLETWCDSEIFGVEAIHSVRAIRGG